MTEFLFSIFEHFGDPRKRVFLGYLILAIGVAFFWLVKIKGLSIRESIFYIFDKRILLSESSRSDFKLFLLNRVFLMFVSPLLISQLAIATIIYYSLHASKWLHVGMWDERSQFIVISIFTIFVFILDDFTKFIVHRWMHKWPMLWSLHKVHHSATTLTPLTIYRTHPLEGVIFILRSSFTQGLSISTFVFMFGDKVDLYTVLGVNVFIFCFNVAGSNLRHSHIGIRYWPWLEYVIISPAQHQLHHSIAEKHYDKNFGVTLALWDWLFGSLIHSEDTEDLTLGVVDECDWSPHSLKKLYLYPFLEIFNILKMKVINVFEIVSRKVKNKRQEM